MHGSKEQKERLAVLNEFRKGNVRLLIATDVSARGIDIADVDFVVNYDLPEYAETYVHRVGRTGRGTKRGIAYSFCDESEKSLLSAIEEYIGKKVKVLSVEQDDYKEVVDLSGGKTMDLKQILEELAPVQNKRYGVKKGKPRK